MPRSSVPVLRLLLIPVIASGGLAACSSDDTAADAPTVIVADAPTSADARSPDGPGADAGPQAITATANVWTWVDFPDSSCDNGSATGIGVNKSATSQNLLIYFEGGGACWNYDSCVAHPTSSHGPFAKTQFDARSATFTGSIMDRAAAMNPFADWSYVYVPYCTGDIHGGDNVATYTSSDGTQTATIHHVGHANVLAYLARLSLTFPSPAKLVISGASAGGFGASINYPAVRDALAPAKSYLVDDSGPSFEGDDLMPALRSLFYTSWKLDLVLGPLCGDGCMSDFSLAYTKLAAKYPSDRLALLESLQDMTIRSYFLLDGPTFQTALLRMAHDVLDPTSNFRYFFISGSTHTMLGSPATFSSNGTMLWTWLTDDVTDGNFTSTVPAID